MKFINAHFIEYEPDKFLSYDDILLWPRKSDVKSRNDPRLSLHTNLTNRISINIPLISANMDTVTGANMVHAMAEKGGFGILHRFYESYELWLADCESILQRWNVLAFSIGASKDDLIKVEQILKLPHYNNKKNMIIVCVDIAHGHLTKCVDQILLLRQRFGESIDIIAGNVCTPDGVVDLVRAGANAIKIGVGGGCFVPGSLINTSEGSKNIEEIEVGNKVLTHDGTYQKVINTSSRFEEDELICINDSIRCTRNHEFYVISRDNADKITDDNLHQYAQWIPAEELNEDYFLVQIQ